MDIEVGSRAEVESKVERVRGYLARTGLAGVLITRQDNFSWLTGGKDNHVSEGSETGVASLLVTADARLALTNRIEAGRMPLSLEAFDVAVAASAFHWFDGERALPEIHRVLRTQGALGLIWNARDEASDWSERLTEIFDELAGPGAPRYRTGRWREAFERHPELFGPLHHRVAYHVHHVTPSAFLDRVLSVSYVVAATEAQRQHVREEVAELLSTDPELRDRDEIAMPYRTDVFWTRAR